MNKILVLGNGFDLAHYLPTTYNHFMTAMQAIVKSKNNEITFDELFADYLENNDEFFLKSKELYKTDEFKLSADLVNQFKEKLESNSWFQYFSKYLENVETWIDFESEIERVLELFVDIFKVFQDNSINFDGSINNNVELSDVFDKDEGVFYKNQGVLDLGFFDELKKKGIYIDLLYAFGVLNKFYVVCDYSYSYDFRRYRLDKKFIVDYSEYLETKCYENKPIGDFNVASKRKSFFERIINKDNLRKYKEQYTSLNEDVILRKLSTQINDFKEIFSLYILEIIDQLQPKTHFKTIDKLGREFSAVFTFNYSYSFQRLYRPSLGAISKVQHLHGNAKVGNIVLGIDDLNDELKPYKIYDFVKTHQKIISNTDYNFLGDMALHINNKPFSIDSRDTDKYPPYEIIIWGHSLDISDKEYIKDIFNINTTLNYPEVYLIIWYYGTPHNVLANLIHIMGKDIIQNWVKKGWLRFEPTPDIYTINQDNKES